MEPLLSYMLLLLLAIPLAHAITHPAYELAITVGSSTGGHDNVTVTSVVNGPSGPITQTGTFVPTTYPGFANISSTIVTDTIITVLDGSSTKLSTYSYTIGPGGVGWNIPTPRSDAPILLSPPTFLPSPGSTSQSNSNRASSISSTTTTFPFTNSTSSKTAATPLSNSTTSHASTSPSIWNTPSGISSPVTSSTISRFNGSTTSTRPAVNVTTFSETRSSEIASSKFTPSIITSSDTAFSEVTSSESTSSKTTSSGTEFSEVTASTTASEDTTPSETSSSEITSSGTEFSEITSSITATTSRTETLSGGIPVTTTSATVSSTITAPPIGFSAVTLSGTSFISNEWVTTTDSDDHTTIVPLIVMGGGVGIVMWGVPPIPNVLFSFPTLPKFHLPCIKFFGASVGSCPSNPVTDGPPDNGDPTDDPTDKSTTTKQTKTTSAESASSSSSECTVTSTVSNCGVECARLTTSNSCVSFTTTCSQTRSGCSVTGTTATTISTTSACTSCSSCLGRQEPGDGVPPFQTPGPVPDDEEFKKRGIAGRVRIDPRDLEKRGAKSTVAKLGTCVLATGTASKLTRPAWPAITPTMLIPDQAGNMAAKYSTISRYNRATTTGPCGVPTTTSLDAAAFVAAPLYTDLAGKVRRNNNDASLDHAYEKSWIKDFFEQLIDAATGAGKLSCADLNQFFFPKAPAPGTCQFNLMQPVWDAIASDKNLYFVAMSQYLNGDGKGRFFAHATKTLPTTFVGNPAFLIASNPTWRWPSGKSPTQTSAKDTLQAMIIYFETVLLGALEMKGVSMLPLIDRTNNRIYDALLNVDNQIATNSAMFPQAAAWQTTFGSGGIAEAYKNYMTSTILPQINVPPTYLTDLWENVIKAGIAAAENLPDVKTDKKTGNTPGPLHLEWEKFSNFANAVDAEYLKSGTYEWEYAFAFTWDRTNKRDEGDEETNRAKLSCPFPSSTGVSMASNSVTSSVTSEISSTVTSIGISTTAVTSSEVTSTPIATPISTLTPSSSSSIPTTTLPPRTAAPDITMATPAESPKCSQGWATNTLQAVASAPANAASLRFYIPKADEVSGDWEFELSLGFFVHPKQVVASWSVGTSAQGPLIASGQGGMDMEIKWTSPKEANGTYVELVFIESDTPVGIQTYGVTARGGRAACIPDACSGPPQVVTDDNGLVCTKFPCSTNISCQPGGPVTPRAACLVVEHGVLIPLWLEVTIVSNNFITDNGDSLKGEEKGCGGLASWERHEINTKSSDGKWTATQAFTFTLPMTIKPGCVERAIASAGGPEGLRCINSQSDWVFI